MNVTVIIALSSIVAMVIGWLWQQQNQNAGIVDAVWAFGMLFGGVAYAMTGEAPVTLRVILSLITVLWFLRLATHIISRLYTELEDGRYQAMRMAMQPREGIGFFLFFQLQAVFIVFMTLPFWVIANNQNPNLNLVALSVLVILLALMGEAASDRQLARFRSDAANQGHTCRNGWWRYSRHPNYFFEWVHWLAYPLMGWGSDFQYWLCLAPVLMWCCLYWFTGIPFSEQQALRSRGDDYRQYQQETNAFFPWWPKVGH